MRTEHEIAQEMKKIYVQAIMLEAKMLQVEQGKIEGDLPQLFQKVNACHEKIGLLKWVLGENTLTNQGIPI